jgi:hypothetical protein
MSTFSSVLMIMKAKLASLLIGNTNSVARKSPRLFIKVSKLWLLVGEITLWKIWVERE